MTTSCLRRSSQILLIVNVDAIVSTLFRFLRILRLIGFNTCRLYYSDAGDIFLAPVLSAAYTFSHHGSLRRILSIVGFHLCFDRATLPLDAHSATEYNSAVNINRRRLHQICFIAAHFQEDDVQTLRFRLGRWCLCACVARMASKWLTRDQHASTSKRHRMPPIISRHSHAAIDAVRLRRSLRNGGGHLPPQHRFWFLPPQTTRQRNSARSTHARYARSASGH